MSVPGRKDLECGEDVDGAEHTTRWSSLLFADGAETCTRASFDSAPLGVPKWAVAGKELVDTKACAAAPSPAALDCLWSALGGSDDLLSRDAVIAQPLLLAWLSERRRR